MTVTLLDQYGVKIDLGALTEEKGKAALASIRNIWYQPVAPGLSPQRLAGILRDAIYGDAKPYLELAEEMEEREPHYASVLSTRKLAVSGLALNVIPASTDKLDVRLADEVRELIERPEFGNVISEMLDALGKGYSAVEIIWNRGSRWEPESYKWRDPKFFRFDWQTGEELRLLDNADPVFGLTLDPYKWIVHRPRLKTGLPIRGGLARLAAPTYCCKSFSVRDWCAFAEVFGMPLRLGKYSSKATDSDIRKLISAVANLGTDAAAVIPDTMRIDFQEASNGAGGGPLFESLVRFFDQQTSKAILGQTMTTDDGSSLGQAAVHNEVRGDIKVADIKQTEKTVNRDLTRPYVDLNHGPQKRYPRIALLLEKPEDLKAFSLAIAPLVDRGLPVSVPTVLKKFGLPMPEAGEMTLGARAMPATPTSPAPEDDDSDAPQGPKPAKPAKQRATNSEEPPEYRDAIDDMRDELLKDWKPLVTPLLDPVQELLNRSTSVEEFQAGLAALNSSMDASAVVERLAVGLFEARALGDATDKV